jgi:pimeloyl-ACP methyl ester carboxylesterase
MGFLTPNPDISYEESRNAGVVETIRLINTTPVGTPLVLIGYSQGADVAIHVAAQFLPGGQLAGRVKDVKRIITFGSPSRPAGPTLLGNNPPGEGISGFVTPDEFRSITWDYVNNGDMYASSTKLLRLFYSILTKMELSVDFAVAAIQILGTAVGGVQQGVLGGILGGLFGTAGANSTSRVINAVAPKATTAQIATLSGLLTDVGDVAQTIKVALQFASTGAHMNYHTWPDFQGKSAVQHAIDGLNAFRW